MRRVHVLVSGVVQGVGFRVSARSVAADHGISGWVRNLPDGRVEAELEGAESDVEAVLEWLRSGPRAARVDGLDQRELDPTGEGGPFEVR